MDNDIKEAVIRIEETLKHIAYRLDQEHIAHKEIEKRVAALEYRVVLWAGAIMGVTAFWSIVGPTVLKSIGLS